MPNLQLIRLAILIHIKVRHFHAQLMKLSIGLPNFRHETKAVLIPKIRAHHLLDAGIFAGKSREPGGAAGGFG